MFGCSDSRKAAKSAALRCMSTQPRSAAMVCQASVATMAVIASWLSAFFIIVANSFMQHPVGALYNPETGRAELNDMLDVAQEGCAQLIDVQKAALGW